MSSWLCPFCNHFATDESIKKNASGHDIYDTCHGLTRVTLKSYLCPNPDCQEPVLIASFNKKESSASGASGWSYKPIDSWVLRPQGAAKPFPDYIPNAILMDYREACLIKDLSPKASATLSRRCLQGMIRDFWSVQGKNLYEEINAIEDKVPADVWDTINAVRKIGNIGAHMEKDIDLIIDVNPEEAGLLIQLIETLISDWYIEREQRRLRKEAILAAAQAKQDSKKA